MEYYIGCGFIINGFCYVEICSLYSYFLHEQMVTFVNVVYYIDWFMYVEQSLWTWDEFHLVVVYDLFKNMLLDLVC